MNEPALSIPIPPIAPSRRFSRTAVIVLVLSYISAGLFYLVARLAGNNLEIHDVCSTFAISIACVGTVWALTQAVRATASGGSALLVLVILFVIGCALTWPLLSMWHARENAADSWAFLHYLCIPLLVPLATFAALIAIPLYLVLCRIFRGENGLAPERRRRATIIARAAGIILFLAVLPFAFVIYGSTMKGITASERNNFWTVRAAKAMPSWIADRAMDLLLMLPAKLKNALPSTMASRGVLSEGYFLPLLEHEYATNEGDYGILMHFPEQYPDAAMKWTKTVLSLPAKLTMLDEELADTFVANASTDEVRTLLRDEARWKGNPKGLHSIILRVLWRRSDGRLLAGDVASIASRDASNQHWKMNFLCIHADDEVLVPAYAEFALNLSNAPMLKRICWQLIRNKRWPVLISALQRENQKLYAGTLVAGLLQEFSGMRAFEKEPLPLALHKPFAVLLEDKDMHLATLAALVVLDSAGEFTMDLEKVYCGKAPQLKSKSIDVQKLENASAEQNQAVIEKARALLSQTGGR